MTHLRSFPSKICWALFIAALPFWAVVAEAKIEIEETTLEKEANSLVATLHSITTAYEKENSEAAKSIHNLSVEVMKHYRDMDFELFSDEIKRNLRSGGQTALWLANQWKDIRVFWSYINTMTKHIDNLKELFEKTRELCGSNSEEWIKIISVREQIFKTTKVYVHYQGSLN